MSMVVIGHITSKNYLSEVFSPGPLSQVIYKAIYCWHMPMFLICSGIVYEIASRNRTLSDTARNKFKRLIIPYLSIGTLLVFPVWYLVGHLDDKAWKGLIQVLTVAKISHIWYLLILFYACVTTNILDNIKVVWIRFVTVIGITFLFDDVVLLLCGYKMGIYLFVNYFIYFELGRLFSKYKPGKTWMEYGKIAFLLVAGMVVESYVWTNQTGGNHFVHKVATIFVGSSLSIALLLVFSRIDSHAKHKVAGLYTYLDIRGMSIYLVHEPLIWLVAFFSKGALSYVVFSAGSIILAYLGGIVVYRLMSKYKITRYVLGL